MCELEIIGESECVTAGDISVGLEEVERQGVSREEYSAEEFGKNVKSYLYTGDRVDDTYKTVEKRVRSSMHGKDSNISAYQSVQRKERINRYHTGRQRAWCLREGR